MEFYFEYRQKDHEKAYEKENKMYSFKKKETDISIYYYVYDSFKF